MWIPTRIDVMAEPLSIRVIEASSPCCGDKRRNAVSPPQLLGPLDDVARSIISKCRRSSKLQEAAFLMILTRSVYEGLSFIRHLRSYYREHVRNVASLYRSDLPGNAIFVDRGTYIVPPLSSSVTHAVWCRHTNFGDGVAEDQIFRKLRAGCDAFLDLGCAEGYYSAMFAVTADRPGRIVAVDLSPEMCRLHKEVAEANARLSGQPIEWSVHQVAVTDAVGNTTLGEGFGGGLVCWYDTDPNRPVTTTTLRGLLSQVGLVPDLIKIDIESYEYELITSSIDYFAEVRPRLHLELHSQLMLERGVSPDRVMELLLKHYRVVGAVPSKYRTTPISRMGLIPIDG